MSRTSAQRHAEYLRRREKHLAHLREKHRLNPEVGRRRAREWRQRNLERALAASRSYREKHRAQLRKKQGKYAKELREQYIRQALHKKTGRPRESFQQFEIQAYREHLERLRTTPRLICPKCGGVARRDGFFGKTLPRKQRYGCRDCRAIFATPMLPATPVAREYMERRTKKPLQKKAFKMGYGATLLPGECEIDYDNPYHLCRLGALREALEIIEEARIDKGIKFEDVEVSGDDLAKYVDKRADHFARVNFPDMKGLFGADVDEPIPDEPDEFENENGRGLD